VSPNEGDHGDRARFRIAIRPEFNGRPPRPEALQVDGRVHGFRYGYTMDEGDTYPGERAWVADREGWPDDAPVWIASGDLQPAE